MCIYGKYYIEGSCTIVSLQCKYKADLLFLMWCVYECFMRNMEIHLNMFYFVGFFSISREKNT